MTPAVLDERAPAWPHRLRSLLEFRCLTLLTVVATYGLIVLGGAVRSTNAGTACPDWPLCHGKIVPQFETKVMTEYSHRVVASLVGFLILGTVLRAWSARREDKPLMRAGALAAVLLALQVIAGGITVGTETAATVVAVHLTIALSLLATLIFIAVCAWLPQRAVAPPVSRVPRLSIAALAAVFALIIAGAFVSQESAGLAYPDWPLFDGKLVSAGGKVANLHYAHRLVAAVTGALLVALMLRTLRRERSPVVLGAMTTAFLLYVAQVFIGASNVWFELAVPVRVLHLALASLLWAVLVFGMMWAHLQDGVNPEGR